MGASSKIKPKKNFSEHYSVAVRELTKNVLVERQGCDKERFKRNCFPSRDILQEKKKKEKW